MNVKFFFCNIAICATILSCNEKNTSVKTDDHLKVKQGEVTVASGPKVSPLWSLDGLVHPESVVQHPDSNLLYVSNIGNDEGPKDPDGFISKVDCDGNIIDLKWIEGLRSPKGLCIANNRLYVSSVTELIEIDIENGSVAERYSADDVQFLNDVTSDDTGNVYVSGMFESAIYKLSPDGKFEKWYQNEELHHPNGLLVDNDNMFIGGWGRLDDAKVHEDSTGYFFKLSMENQELKKITPNKPGKLDGIQVFDDGFLVSSWKEGEILSIKSNGEYRKILDTETSVGDIFYHKDKKLLVLPMNFQNKLEAYQVD